MSLGGDVNPGLAGPRGEGRNPPAPAGAGFWRDSWRRFRRQRLALAALCFVVVLILVAILAPFIVGTRPIVCYYKGEVYFPVLEYYYRGGENAIFFRDGFQRVYPTRLKKNDPESWALWPLVYQDPYRPVAAEEWPGDPGNKSRQPPSRRHFFGTDEQRRDVFARIVFGTRVAVLVGFVSMAIAGTVGITLGAVAGFFGGKVDMVISRAIELMMSVPTLILVLALVSVIERPQVFHLMLLIGLTRWESIARYTRGEVIRVKECEFILAARALGARWHRILFRHILPNALTPALVAITFGIGSAVLIESALSFLGFGVPRTTPSWGGVLAEWQGDRASWWLVVFPGLAVFLTVLAYNLIGDGVQDATDPRRRSKV